MGFQTEKMRTHLIFVVVLYLCGVSFSQGNRKECRRQLQENVNFPGSDIRNLFSPGAEHCQQLCTQHPSCLFWSGDFRQNNSHCFLKTSTSERPNRQRTVKGVTSGYSLKPCNPDPNPCLSKVYQNVDFPGADYNSLFTADYEECQRACTQDPSCQFFTFINENFTSAQYRYKCQLKFSWTVPTTPQLRLEAGLESGFSHSVQMSRHDDITECKTTLFPNTDIPGNDIQSLTAASPEHCHALCSAHPQCSYFSFTSDDFMCYLKNNSNEMEVQAKERVTSGIPARSCQLNNNWLNKRYEGVDFWGSDLDDLLAVDAEACQRTCTNFPGCQFFTYVTMKHRAIRHWHICYLKRVITMPSPPKVTKLANVVSGFSLRNCDPHTHTETASDSHV
ncbi:coagulation factor XI-like [Centropristis striata]|uniref:coagulation factor XI-like n=1 Tax=Centropristis striata TaxID=184440 RepID=UPI0027E02F08|nr:coagulation factor XI-like [Centropristis striata]